MLAETLDVVVGVDTHKHTHTAADVAGTGAVIEHLTVPANPKGYRQLLAFGQRHRATLWAIEGTAALAPGSRLLFSPSMSVSSRSTVRSDRPVALA
jgi:transposase